jgi:NAD-dependent SIR2 family protein deacetylase
VKTQVSVILGAGFSCAAGLPLTNALFDTDQIPPALSLKVRERHKDVLWAWKAWRHEHPDQGAEIWLKQLYDNRDLPAEGADWNSAVRFMLGRLALISDADKAPYLHGITLSVASDVHRRFWSQLRASYQIRAVVTTNYDILIEQGLRSEYTRHRISPACFYAGLRCPQIVERPTDVARHKKELHKLDDTGTALCKLHGSINWAFDHGEFKLHEDVRAAFRGDTNKRDSRPRMAAVIPPLPEKEVPAWLQEVWSNAERHLRETHLWIVCGSSLPSYDEAFMSMLTRAAERQTRLHVIQCDESESARQNWRNVLGPRTEIRYARYLPEGLSDPAWETGNITHSMLTVR